MWLFLKSIKIPQTAGFSHGHGDWDSSLFGWHPHIPCVPCVPGSSEVPTTPVPPVPRSASLGAAKCSDWRLSQDSTKVDSGGFLYSKDIKLLDQEKVLWKNMALLCIAGIAAWSFVDPTGGIMHSTSRGASHQWLCRPCRWCYGNDRPARQGWWCWPCGDGCYWLWLPVGSTRMDVNH